MRSQGWISRRRATFLTATSFFCVCLSFSLSLSLAEALCLAASAHRGGAAGAALHVPAMSVARSLGEEKTARLPPGRLQAPPIRVEAIEAGKPLQLRSERRHAALDVLGGLKGSLPTIPGSVRVLSLRSVLPHQSRLQSMLSDGLANGLETKAPPSAHRCFLKDPGPAGLRKQA